MSASPRWRSVGREDRVYGGNTGLLVLRVIADETIWTAVFDGI